MTKHPAFGKFEQIHCYYYYDGPLTMAIKDANGDQWIMTVAGDPSETDDWWATAWSQELHDKVLQNASYSPDREAVPMADLITGGWDKYSFKYGRNDFARCRVINGDTITEVLVPF